MMQFDQATLICRICKREHVIYPDRPLTTKELPEWLKTKVMKFCDCPAERCDVKFRIKEAAK